MTDQQLRITVAGATGWAGSALTRGICAAPDLALVSAVSRSADGRSAGEVLGVPGLTAPIHATAAAALAVRPEVFVEYTKPDVAKANVLGALDAGAHVVIGTSGLTASDFDEIDRTASERSLGVLACGNFALTAVLMMKFSAMAARWIKSREIIDYAHAGKVDAPSGTARELARRLAAAGPTEVAVPLDDVQGERAARGATLEGTQVHSVRAPGYVIAIESIFGMESQKLVIRHEAGASAEPYVDGALLAIRRVGGLTGLHRGLDSVMAEADGV